MVIKMEISELETGFIEHFGIEPSNYFFSPGRINLIGEHTDYNGGHVFPAAISLGTYAAVGRRNDRELHFFSANYPDQGEISVQLTNLDYNVSDSWTNYAKGMFLFVQQQTGATFDSGLNIFVKGDLPSSSGLSSSASMELLIGIIIQQMYHIQITQLDLVKIGQKVENEFIGVNSGIMDQFAVGMGKQDQAIFLDTNTLEYKLFPINLTKQSIVIMNTNKPRDLISGNTTSVDLNARRRYAACNALCRLSLLANLAQQNLMNIALQSQTKP